MRFFWRRLERLFCITSCRRLYRPFGITGRSRRLERPFGITGRRCFLSALDVVEKTKVEIVSRSFVVGRRPQV